MLDVTFRTCSHGDGRLSYEILKRPTSQWSPLSWQSSHPPSVHSAWPRAQVLRYKRLCFDRRRSNREILEFMSALGARGAPEGIMTLATSTCCTKPRQPCSPVQTIRFVMPYNVAWYRARVAAVLRRGLRGLVHCSIAWKFGSPHTIAMVQKFAHEYHSELWWRFPTIVT